MYDRTAYPARKPTTRPKKTALMASPISCLAMVTAEVYRSIQQEIWLDSQHARKHLQLSDVPSCSRLKHSLTALLPAGMERCGDFRV